MNNVTDSFSSAAYVFSLVANFWWVILPIPLYLVFKLFWMDHIQTAFSNNLKWTLLEIIPPKELEQSPKVIESLYTGIAGVVVTVNPFDMYLKGVFLDQFSFELVGEEGNVHFYIRMQTKFRNMIEAQVYAKYPDATVLEVDDYVQRFPKTIPNKNWDLWGADLQFLLPDAYPIKTYDKFTEDVTGKMIDPMAALTEVLAKLGPGQHIWLQYVICPLPEKWRKDQMHLVQKLAGRAKKESGGLTQHLVDVFSNIINGMFAPVEFKTAKAEADLLGVEQRLTPGERDVLKALEDNLGKNSFEVKGRILVLGRKEVFDKTFVTAFFGAMKQFNDLNMNSFKPEDASKTFAYYIMKDRRISYRKRKIYQRYKDRDMSGVKFVLSTTELATVFHFPDMLVKTPTMDRVASRRGSAPSNLPIQ